MKTITQKEKNLMQLKSLFIASMVVAAGAAQAQVAVQLYNAPASDPTYQGQNGGPIPFGTPFGSAFSSPNVQFGTDFGWNWWPLGTDVAFGAQVTGFLTVPSTGTYQFGTESDDGSLLYLDGQTIGSGGNQPPTTYLGTFNLTGGTPYAFTIDFLSNNIGTSGLDFDWIDFNGNQNPVPAAFLTPEPAPFAALGLGALGLLIRRRRKA